MSGEGRRKNHNDTRASKLSNQEEAGAGPGPAHTLPLPTPHDCLKAPGKEKCSLSPVRVFN